MEKSSTSASMTGVERSQGDCRLVSTSLNSPRLMRCARMIISICKLNRLGEDVKLPRKGYETAHVKRPGKGWKYPVYPYETGRELEDSGERRPDNRNARAKCQAYWHKPKGLDFDLRLFNEIMNTTTTTMAENGVQADAQQELTSPTLTSTFTTPTLTFGEVGTTLDQETPGYLSKAHGVGHFEETKLLERSVLLDTFAWSVGDPPDTLFLADVDSRLRHYGRNKSVLEQFRYMRANIEITVRLNTNQFYYGALMVNMWPTETTGNWVDELAVLDPTIISASTAESVIKTWNYAWPHAWKLTADSSTPVWLSIRSMTPLTAGPSMPDTITVQLWGRFTDVELSYPCLQTITAPAREVLDYAKYPKSEEKEKEKLEVQSANGGLVVRKNRKKAGLHPGADEQSHAGGNPVGTMVSAVSSVASEVANDLDDLISGGVGGLMGALSFLDKPDRADPQGSVINEASSDLFLTDVADTNVSVGTYKDRYVDPGKGRMPMSKAWTVSQYAQIPGIRAQWTFFEGASNQTTPLIRRSFPTDSVYRIPLDYAFLNATMWRGSIKVVLQFFTSAFISARFVLQYINEAEFPASYESDYTNGLARVINVKGDTTEQIELPWLSRYWWTSYNGPAIKLSLASTIASSDPSLDAKIYCIAWVAGGDDIQFAYPRTPFYYEWPYRGFSESLSVRAAKFQKKKKGKNEVQAAVHSLFEKKFEPIAENCVYDVDNGFCTAETLGLITDVCKRYGRMVPNTQLNIDILDGGMLDNWFVGPTSGPQYGCWQAFRATFFGSWRAAFLFRSGGYRWRRYTNRGKLYHIQSSSSIETQGTLYCPPFDGTNRLTVPQVMPFPYGMLGIPNQQLSIVGHDLANGVGNETVYVAARDDIQLGYPILPTGYPENYDPGKKDVKQRKAGWVPGV